MVLNRIYRITTFIPPEHVDALLEGREVPLQYGKYDQSAWWSAVGVEQFRPMSGATPMQKNRRATFEDLRVRVNGDTAIATSFVANADESGGNLRRTMFTDIFVFRKGYWKAVNAQENAIPPGS